DRVLIALRKRGRLPDNVQRTDDGLIARLYGLLERTGKLDGGWPGYPEAKQLRGVVLEATGADGTPLLFVAVRGGEVSNAHFPYYEFLFANSAASKEPILLSAKRFYFDVSGLEGNEWPWFFFLLSVVGFIITMGLLVPFARFRALRAAERQAARNDPAPQPEPEAVSDLPLGL
ncbi:MAG TPA: hypothetical protein VGZ22_15760, partial [Isosphaeraceae bacterium]|nr:hypothetical protein [Isosphaeraceae bacterium]